MMLARGYLFERWDGVMVAVWDKTNPIFDE
jgi:hypothetical protein